jgi:hypothetical protein
MKLKTCDICGEEKPIWKSSGTGGLRYCKYCWSCHKSKDKDTQKPKTSPSSSKLKQKSDKQKAIDKAYTLMRKEYLNKHPMCEIKLPGCTGHATDIHHTEYRGINTLAQATWLAVCRGCHDWCHSNPKEARELGYLK